MAGAVPKVENLLFSTTTTDVFEAVEFFKTGYMFDIKGTEAGMRKMLRLLYICSGQEKNEKGEAVIRAYQTVFFQTDATERYKFYQFCLENYEKTFFIVQYSNC